MAYGPKFHLSENSQKYDKSGASQKQPIEKNNFGFHLSSLATLPRPRIECCLYITDFYLYRRDGMNAVLWYGELVVRCVRGMVRFCYVTICNSQVGMNTALRYGELVLW